MQRARFPLTIVTIVLAGGFFAASACGSGPAVAPQQTQPAASGTQATAGVRPAISINAMMVALVDHAAHAVWDVPQTPPRSDTDWQQLEYHAMQLAAAGTLISTGGTGPADPGWVQLPAWRESSQRLTDDGVAALDAVRRKDVAALSAVGDRLLQNCESCHKQFKPEVPTEGLVHTPAYAH